MNKTEQKRNRKNWPGNCGYCHQFVIWHREWEGQVKPIPLNDMELGGDKHSCHKYFNYRRMMKRLQSMAIDSRPQEGEEILRVIRKDSIADWQKKNLQDELRQIVAGHPVRLPRTLRTNKHSSSQKEYDPKVIRIGSSVLLRGVDGREQTFLLADWNDKKAALSAGTVTPDSPLATALLGHQPGDEVTNSTPTRQIVYQIVAVEQTLPPPRDIDDRQTAA